MSGSRLRAALLVLLCAALAGCAGGGERRAADPAERERAAAVASVARLADAVRDEDVAAACRSLTGASRRVVALVGQPGGRCTAGLDDFLVVHGLRRALPEAEDLEATVDGARAAVRGTGLPRPLTASRGDGGEWLVSLVGLPGVRADVGAARACGSWFRAADRRALPPFAGAALVARLRAEARAVDALRRRLRALPAGGPPRLGLPQVTRALAAVGSGLRRQAGRVAAGGEVERGMQASARADRLVRAVLGEEGVKARVACPPDVTKGATLVARREVLDAACDEYAGAIDALDAVFLTPEEARAALRGVDRALAQLDRGVRRAPVPAGLRTLRARTRAAVARLRSAVTGLGTSATDAGRAEQARLVGGYGTQVDVALIRLGATCLDAGGGGASPSPPPSPPPAPTPPSPSDPPPDRGPRPQLPEGTIES